MVSIWANWWQRLWKNFMKNVIRIIWALLIRIITFEPMQVCVRYNDRINNKLNQILLIISLFYSFGWHRCNNCFSNFICFEIKILAHIADASFDDDGSKIAVYKFGTVENNNEEVINSRRYRISRGSKDNGTKFRMKDATERASLLMQFLILYDRNFKASIRNAVCILTYL